MLQKEYLCTNDEKFWGNGSEYLINKLESARTVDLTKDLFIYQLVAIWIYVKCICKILQTHLTMVTYLHMLLIFLQKIHIGGENKLHFSTAGQVKFCILVCINA
jgi:hypothetical protein